MVDFYKKRPKSERGPYDRVDTRLASEIDLRAELTELLRANQRGTWFLYRHARMDANGKPIKHPYVNETRSGEPPIDVGQMDSTDRGYLYDDYMVFGYMNHSQAYSIYKKKEKAGDSTVDYRTVYLEYDVVREATGRDDLLPTKFDRIIRVEKDLSGKVQSPLQIKEKYDILSVDPYRLDSSGRIEYYRLRVISVPDESIIV
jgi:hypothetical protein